MGADPFGGTVFVFRAKRDGAQQNASRAIHLRR
jgi:hypothetical protein